MLRLVWRSCRQHIRRLDDKDDVCLEWRCFHDIGFSGEDLDSEQIRYFQSVANSFTALCHQHDESDTLAAATSRSRP